MTEFKCHKDLAEDNPSGMDTLENPCNFSNNPGFMGTGTAEMLSMARPGNGETGTIRTAGARMSGGVPMRRGSTTGRTATFGNGSIGMPAAGDTDPGAEYGPLGRTSGYSG